MNFLSSCLPFKIGISNKVNTVMSKSLNSVHLAKFRHYRLSIYFFEWTCCNSCIFFNPLLPIECLSCIWVNYLSYCWHLWSKTWLLGTVSIHCVQALLHKFCRSSQIQFFLFMDEIILRGWIVCKNLLLHNLESSGPEPIKMLWIRRFFIQFNLWIWSNPVN